MVCRRVAEDSIKNYQLWNHRRKIALALGPAAAEQELQFCTGELRTHCVLTARRSALRFHQALCCQSAANPACGSAQKACPCVPCVPACHAEALDADSKNYHAWAHRQVVVAAAGAWQPEMEYLECLLQADVRNNSAWNQRAFVIRVSWVVRQYALLERVGNRSVKLWLTQYRAAVAAAVVPTRVCCCCFPAAATATAHAGRLRQPAGAAGPGAAVRR